MNEKRFEVDVDHLLLVWDTEKNKRLEIEDIVGVLNEQQSDLNYLARFIGEFKVDEFKEKLRTLRTLEDKVGEQQATIEQLRQSQDVKEFSALFNQSIALQREIKDLKEENEQLRQKLDFYLLDEFEWKEKYGD